MASIKAAGTGTSVDQRVEGSVAKPVAHALWAAADWSKANGSLRPIRTQTLVREEFYLVVKEYRDGNCNVWKYRKGKPGPIDFRPWHQKFSTVVRKLKASGWALPGPEEVSHAH